MQRYLTLLLGLLIGLLIATALLNRLINPYALFDGPSLAGINDYKPEVATRQRLAKAYQVRQLRPDMVFLGSSRGLALPTDHPACTGHRCFNLALSGSLLYEHWRYLQHAQANQPLKVVVAGLDHFNFNEGKPERFDDARLSVDAEGRTRFLPFGIAPGDLLPGLLSHTALISSLETVRHQHEASIDPAVTRRERIARKGGHHALFTESERGLFEILRKRQGMDFRYREVGTLAQPGTFRRMLRLAHREGFDLRLFISPSHARLWEVWTIGGMLPAIERWKEELVTANAEEAALAGRAPFPLWDFSGYNSITTEPLPASGDTTTIMHGYWEGHHYSTALAHQILDRLFTLRAPHQPPPDDFGVLLDQDNIDTHQQRLRRDAEQWRTQHPADMAELDQFYREAFHRAPPPK